jgi:molybdopterin biosynthesis enzyme
MKPGSPTSLGTLYKNKPVIVLPGYPVSAYVALYTFGIPALYRMLGTVGPPVASITARLTASVKLHSGMQTFVRVKISKSNNSCFFAKPITAAGASLLSTLAHSDGIVIANDKKQNNLLSKGDQVQVLLLRSINQ